jgi:hypothetical protein
MKQLFVSVFVVATMGCASGTQYNSNVGRHIDDVVARLGEPNKSYSLPDGRKAYEFDLTEAVDTEIRPSTGNIDPYSKDSASRPHRSCLVRVIAGADRIVQEVHAEGSGC